MIVMFLSAETDVDPVKGSRARDKEREIEVKRKLLMIQGWPRFCAGATLHKSILECKKQDTKVLKS